MVFGATGATGREIVRAAAARHRDTRRVFGQRFWAGKSSGNGVHNPFLLETLMTVSVAALRTCLDEGQN